MADEFDTGNFSGNFNLSQVFNTQQTPELNQPQTYSWNDFFDPQYSNQIGDKWEPQQYLSLGSNNPVDVSQYTFTSLPYQYKEGYVADIKTPSFEGFRPMPNVWRGGNAGYFTDNGGLPYMQQSGKWVVPVGDKSEGTFQQILDQAVPLIAGGMVTGGLGGGLAGAFGGGVLGSAAGYGLAGGTTAEIQGGDFGKGFLGGAVSGGMQGLSATGSSPASMAGINSPTLAKMFNRGVGGTLGSLASGNSGSDALKSGLTGAALSGINSVGKSVMNPYIESFKSWLGSGQQQGTEGDYSTGSTSYGSNYMAPGQEALRAAGLFPEMSNVPPSSSNFQTLDTIGLPSYDSNPYANASYAEGGYKPNGVNALEQAGLINEMSYALPGSEGDYGGSFLNSILSDNGPVPDQSIQSSTGQPNFSLQSVLGDVGSRVGNFALNNVGDLASMLYGFYNNRRQQRQLQQPMNNMSNQVNQATTQLQNMFTQNSPYAQQLRAKLNAQAAQSGRRSNIAGRETQFQAMLAEKAASTLPQIANMQNSLMQNQLQMQQRRGQLQSSLGSNTISLLGKMGAFNGLANMFGPSTTTIPYNNGNVSGSDMFGWKGSGGM